MIKLVPVDQDNWRSVAGLKVGADQRDWVNDPAYYLALCHYSPAGWQPLAIANKNEVVGFLMWAVDPDDGAAWLGGITVGQAHQGKGYGRAAVKAIIAQLCENHGIQRFALSYEPANIVARSLYTSLGFQEAGELEDTEVVARLAVADPLVIRD